MVYVEVWRWHTLSDKTHRMGHHHRSSGNQIYVSGWRWLEHDFYFSIIILGTIIIPIDFHIFQRGGSTTNQYMLRYEGDITTIKTLKLQWHVRMSEASAEGKMMINHRVQELAETAAMTRLHATFLWYTGTALIMLHAACPIQPNANYKYVVFFSLSMYIVYIDFI